MAGCGEEYNKHIHTEKHMHIPLKTQWETLIGNEKTRKAKKMYKQSIME